MITLGTVLNRNQVISYVGQHASAYGLDPAAVLSVANHEGLNTSPGSSWTVPGESHISFGPPSWYSGPTAAGETLVKQYGQSAPQWAWTPAGLDYWLQSIANVGASGLTGVAAIRQIVTGFERPRADLVAGEITNASNDYQKFSQQIATGPVTPIPSDHTEIPIPGVQTGENSTTTAPPSGQGGTNAGSIGPWPINIPTGLIIGLLGVVLLIVGALLFAFQFKYQQPSVNVRMPRYDVPVG